MKSVLSALLITLVSCAEPPVLEKVSKTSNPLDAAPGQGDGSVYTGGTKDATPSEVDKPEVTETLPGEVVTSETPVPGGIDPVVQNPPVVQTPPVNPTTPTDGTKPPEAPKPDPIPPKEVFNFSVVQSEGLKKDFNLLSSPLSIANVNGAEILKGQTARVKFGLKAAAAGKIVITPIISAKRFSDYDNVRLPSFTIDFTKDLEQGVSFDIPSIFSSGSKRYALAASGYKLDLEISSGAKTVVLRDFKASRFDIGHSNVVFFLVGSTKTYMSDVKASSIEELVKESFANKIELYNPTTQTSVAYPKGFDQFLGFKTVFDFYEMGNIGDDTAPGFDHFKGITADFQKYLGLPQRFDNAPEKTLTNLHNHGFDNALALTHQYRGGGLNYGSVSLVGSTSPNMAGMYIMHEVGHGYGAPHCDPHRGYMMCNGENNPKWISEGLHVWLNMTKLTMVRGIEILPHLKDHERFAP